MRFDPSSRAVWSVAVLPRRGQGQADVRRRTDQLGRPGAEEAAGERRAASAPSRWWAAPSAKSTSTSTRGAWRRWASRADQVVAAVRSENQDLPVGAIRSLARSAWCRSRRACNGPRISASIIVTRRGTDAAGRRGSQVARQVDGRRTGGGEPGALQRPAHAVAVGAEVAGREHHRRWSTACSRPCDDLQRAAAGGRAAGTDHATARARSASRWRTCATR